MLCPTALYSLHYPSITPSIAAANRAPSASDGFTRSHSMRNFALDRYTSLLRLVLCEG